MYSSLEDKNLVSSDSYTYYEPTKFKTPQHPSKVVEATTLSFVPTPKIHYDLQLLKSKKYNKDSLSGIQLEAVALAHQKFEEFSSENYRLGFFLGDAAGLGKGRTIAGTFLENLVNNRKKGIWVTISQDLFKDCERDCKAVSQDINLVKIKPTFDFDIGRIPESAVICITYATLCRDGNKASKKSYKKERKSRFEHILDWFLKLNDGDGLIVLDECHKSKGLHETRIGNIVQKLQSRLSNARIMYSTATAASNPNDLVYMSRLGLWPIKSIGERNWRNISSFVFSSSEHFVSEVERRGISSMESIAIEMKQSGSLISRLLSFKDVETLMLRVNLEEDFIQMYDASCKLWSNMYSFLLEHHPQGKSKKILSMFWSNNLNYFQSLITSSKVKLAADYGMDRVSNHRNSIVYGLQKTGDSQYNILAKKKFKKFSRSYSHAAAILAFAFENIFNVDLYYLFNNNDKSDQGSNSEDDSSDSSDADEEITEESSSYEETKGESTSTFSKNENLKPLIDQFKSIFKILPPNPIDSLTYKLGGPAYVSELTGRKIRAVNYFDLDKLSFPINRKSHTTDRKCNIKEIENFQSGLKKFAIISDAASTGVSLHSEKSSQNLSKRIHITLECAYSAEKYIQQLGRTHRSNQETPPLYVFILSSIPAEDRFLWGISDKLSKLGAITKGDRNSTQTFYDLDKNLNSYYGDIALKRLINQIRTGTIISQNKNFNLTEIRGWLNVLGVIDSDKNTSKLGTKNAIHRFLNRALNLPLSYQKELLDAFYKLLEEEIDEAIKNKTYNAGVLEYTIPALAEVTIISEIEFLIRGGEVIYYAIQVDKGLSWEQLMSYGKESINPRFLVYSKIRSQILFAYTKDKTTYVVQPSNCEAVPLSTLCPNQFEKKYQTMIKVTQSGSEIVWPQEAKKLWDSQYKMMSSGDCIHAYTNQLCIAKNCVAGARINFNGIISGRLNSIWTLVEEQLGRKNFALVRVVCKEDNRKIVGILLENSIGEKLCHEFEKISR